MLLSIPFGMLRVYANFATWLSPRFQFLLGCYRRARSPSGVMYQLSIPFGMLRCQLRPTHKKLASLSIPFGMLPKKYFATGAMRVRCFQFLLGCYCESSRGGNREKTKLSIPFGMLRGMTLREALEDKLSIPFGMLLKVYI